MFKAPKKAKKRKQVLSTVADSSSDEEERETTGDHKDEEPADDGDGGGGSIGALEAAQLKIKARKDKQKKNQKRSGSSAGTGGGVSFNPEEHEGGIDGFDDDAAQGSRRDRKKQRKKDDKKKRKKRSGGMGFGGATMSFHDDDEEEDAAAESASASASAGIGYTATGYGASASGRDDDDDQDATGGGSLYGSAALEALRSKQKVFVAPRGDVNSKEGGDEDKSKQDAPTDTATRMDAEQPDASAGTGTSKPKDPELGDGQTNFIPLDGSSIVAGDDALAYMEEEDDEREGMANPEADAARRKQKRNLMGTDRLSNASGGDMGAGVGNDSILGGLGGDAKDGEIDAGGRQWEEEVARRAGIASRGQQEGRQSTSSSPVATLTTMRSTISKTLTHLRQRREDLESSHDRRRNELQGVEDDLRRQEEDLRAGGSAFEYYQDLRVDIADWVGALRNLSTKIDTITDAIREQEADLAERRRSRLRQREDDAAAILQSKSLLDGVIGRQVQLSDDNNVAPAVDEFGRDIQSAEALARERRIVRRRRVEKESLKRVNKRQKAEAHVVQCDSDADLSDNEIDELGQRIDALEEALLLAKDELDDRYCSLATLQNLFMSWEKHSPEDYRRCYAKLSLGDMAAVLVNAETCTKINTLQCTKYSDIYNVADFDWVLTTSSFESSESPQEEKSSKGEVQTKKDEGGDDHDEKLTCAISRKVVLPYFLLLMGEGSNGEMGDPLYDPFSSRQTELIKGLYLFLKNMLKSDANAIQRSAQSILDVFKANLDKMTVILVKPDALKVLGGEGTNSGTDDDQSEMESVTCSILEQANRLRKFISNAAALSSLFVHVGSGVPQRDLASFILLEAIAARLLPVLSPLQNADACGNQKAETILQMVWNDIMEAGWLDDKALMLQTAPIRAALHNKHVVVVVP